MSRVRGDGRAIASALAAAALAACGIASGADRVEVASGTVLTATLDQELTTKTSSEGDPVTATVTAPVSGEGGAVLVPSGAKLHGEVTGVRDEGNQDRPAYVAIHFHELEMRGSTMSLDSARLIEANPAVESETHDEAAKIGGGAAAGALLGGLISGEAEGAVAGGLVGAVAGTAVTLGTAHQHAYLPRSSRVRVELGRSIQVPPASEEGADDGRAGDAG